MTTLKPLSNNFNSEIEKSGQKTFLFLYGPLSSLEWGRGWNIAQSLSELGYRVHYLNCQTLGHQKNINNSGKIEIYRNGFSFPYIKFPFLKILNFFLQHQKVRQIRKKLESVDYLVFNGVPPVKVVDDWIENFKEAKVLYDCADSKKDMFHDFGDFKAEQSIKFWEKYLVSRCDIISGTNNHILNGLDPLKKKQQVQMPNGISSDVNYSDHQLNLSGIKLICSGDMGSRLDWEKLIIVLKKCPFNWSLDLYGPSKPDCLELIEMPNVHFKGLVSFRKLMKIMSDYDFGMLPYKDLISIRKSDPLKIKQYLSAGLPVLAFPYKGLPSMKGVHILDENLWSRDLCSLRPISNDSAKWKWKTLTNEWLKSFDKT